jgi:hypothetical protein
LAAIQCHLYAFAAFAAEDLADISNLPASPSTDTERFSFWNKIDMHWGGRLRTSGFVSWPDDDTIYQPVGTGTFYDASANLRLTNETFFTDTIFAELHYELVWAGGDSIEKQNELEELFPGLPDNLFLPGAPLNDDRRLLDLTDVISDNDDWFLVQRLDRLYLALLPNWGSIRIGRQAITWGNGLVFNPMDLFNPFPPTAIDRDYKAGDDMINAQFAASNIGDGQLLYVARRDPDTDNVELDQASLAGKLHAAIGSTEFDVMASKHFEDEVVGLGTTGYLKDAAWRVDATWTFLNDGDDYLSLVANMDYSWVWFDKNFYGFVEYFYIGLGKDDYSKALLDPNIVERLARGELFVLGKNYFSGQIQVEIHPLVKLTMLSITNIEDPSGVLQPYLLWDIIQNLQMTAGANVYYGSNGSEYGGFKIPGTDLRTASADSMYLWVIYYF